MLKYLLLVALGLVITIGLTNRDMRFFRYTYPFRVNR